MHRYDLHESTVYSLQQAMHMGKLTSRDIVLYYLERIARYDRSGPAINSILEVNPDAVHQAEALDHERTISGSRGPLHGIPVLLKDNIDTCDKLHTSAGSRALKDNYANEDAFLVSQLRQAGAIILGKANMTEWANFMTAGMNNGYSSRGGQVLNPYGPGKFDVGGSSSGSAAAVAANLTMLAVGTETSGSILSPASSNSAVGFKPTLGLISRSGVIPIAHSMDTAGPIARTVADAAVLLGALTGVDERDPATVPGQGRSFTDYTQFLNPHALRGARIGIPREYYKWLKDDTAPVMDRCLQFLKHAGAVLVDGIEIPAAKEPMNHAVLLYEFKPALNAYLGRLAPHMPIHSLKELVEFNDRYPEEMLKYGQTLLTSSEEKSGSLAEPEYINARLRDLYLSREQGVDFALREYNLQAIVFPNNFAAGLGARAGYPSITVPGGYTDEGKPLGVTFTSTAWSEPLLIALAYSFEQATMLRRPPILD